MLVVLGPVFAAEGERRWALRADRNEAARHLQIFECQRRPCRGGGWRRKTLSITAGEFWFRPNGLKAVAGLVSSNAARSALRVHLIPSNALSAIIFAVAEPAFPVPGLKVIAELTQITL